MQGYNSQSNNIYGYPPQYGGNFYVQPSSNIYAQPGWNNPGYGAQLSGNAYVPSVQNNPINVQKVQSKVTTSTAPSTMEPLVPLVPTSNEANIEKNSCFKSFWEKFDTIEELTGYQKCGVIFTCVVHCIIDFNEIAYTSSTKSINLGLFLSMDLLYIAFAIFTCVSTIKVRMLRLIDSVLAIIFAILSIIRFGMDLFRFIFFGTFCVLAWISVFFPRIRKFSVIIFSNKFSASFCPSFPSVTPPIMQILVHLMLS